MTDDDTEQGGVDVVRVLLPVNWQVSIWVSLFGFGLAGIAFLVLGLVWLSEGVLEFGTVESWGLYALAFAAVVGAAVNGYLNDDLLVSLFIALAPLLGFVLFLVTGGAATGLDEFSTTGQDALLLGVGAAILGAIAGGGGVWAGREYGGGPGTEGLR